MSNDKIRSVVRNNIIWDILSDPWISSNRSFDDLAEKFLDCGRLKLAETRRIFNYDIMTGKRRYYEKVQTYYGNLQDVVMDAKDPDFKEELRNFWSWFGRFKILPQYPITTLFHINKLCAESLPLILMHLEKLNCSQLVSIRIVNFEGDGALIDQLLAHPKLAKLKHVVLPQECQDLEFDSSKCGFSFTDFSVFRPDNSIVADKISDPTRLGKDVRATIPSYIDVGLPEEELGSGFSGSGARSGRGRSRQIAIGSGIMGSRLDVGGNSGEVPICRKVNCGEILNGDDASELYVRTQIIDHDITKDLEQRPYLAKKYENVDVVRILSEEEIEALKSVPAAAGNFYRFNLSLRAGSNYRLSSIRSQEELEGILVNNGANITITRGDDDFFYARADAYCDLSYVIKTDAIESSYRDIPPEHIIHVILDDYMDPVQGFKMLADDASLKMPEYRPENHKQWLEEVYEKRLGSCRHRVAAVEYMLLANGVSPDDVRVVDINKNHVMLEVRYEGSWYGVDLGGSNRMRIVKSSSKYKARSVEQQVMAQEEMRDFEVKKDPAIEDVREKDLVRAGGGGGGHDGSGREDRTLSPSELSRGQRPGRAALLPPLFGREELSGESVALLESKPDLPPSPIDEAIAQMMQVEYVNEKEKLFGSTINSEKSKILVTASDVEGTSNKLLSNASRNGVPVFYIDGPDKIDFDRLNIALDEDISPEEVAAKVKIESDLGKFLKYCADNPTQNPILMINWSNFNARQRLALNSLLDLKPTIHGRKVPDNVKIIGFSSSKIKDQSFISRHDGVIESRVFFTKDEVVDIDEDATMKIDFCGSLDWRQKLFGPLVIIGDKIIWKKSPFILALESGEVAKIEALNLDSKQFEKMRYEIEKAKATSYFIYHGRVIPFPDNLQCAVSKEESFDFAKINKDGFALKKRATQADVPGDAIIINTHLFDILLQDKEITDDKKYVAAKGLLDRAAESGEKLKLFITSELSEIQWYALLKGAEEKGVKLELFLAPGIFCPARIDIEPELEEVSGPIPPARPKPRIIISNDTAQTASKIIEAEDDYLVIDVEDYSYQDLVEKIDFDIEEDGFKNFERQTSQLLTALKAGQKIILKGEFAEDLLQMLQPILVSKAPEFDDITNNLIVLIEDNVSASQTIYEPLKWLGEGGCQFVFEERKPKAAAPILFEEKAPNLVTISEDSAARSEEFFTERRRQVSLAMTSNSLVQLVGHSGVGKSALMRSYEKDFPEDVEIFNEMSDFDEWAQKDPDGKVRILFIDESNIDDMHFTMFSPLKKGGSRQVLHKGKIYDIDDDHKVVFACNPKSYGGGRASQKLFEDGQVPQFYLKDFPADYIYETILRQGIYEKCGDELKGIISEEEFKDICQKKILNYQALNSQARGVIENQTVRELQEAVLVDLAERIYPNFAGVFAFSENFMPVAEVLESEKVLHSSIRIRKMQRQGSLPNEAVGTPAVLLEGDSGVGKSEMIRAVLNREGIMLVDGNSSAARIPGNPIVCYKIDASLSLEEKTKILARAVDEGNMVLLDELNSCIDDGLEKVLNKALTGINPITDKKAARPGFMMLSTANQANNEGRSPISPALYHRMNRVKVKPLTEYSKKSFCEIVDHLTTRFEKPCYAGQDDMAQRIQVAKDMAQRIQVAKDMAQRIQVAKDIALRFYDLVNKEESNLNLRMLRQLVNENLLNAELGFRRGYHLKEDMLEAPSTVPALRMRRGGVFDQLSSRDNGANLGTVH